MKLMIYVISMCTMQFTSFTYTYRTWRIGTLLVVAFYFGDGLHRMCNVGIRVDMCYIMLG